MWPGDHMPELQCCDGALHGAPNMPKSVVAGAAARILRVALHNDAKPRVVASRSAKLIHSR